MLKTQKKLVLKPKKYRQDKKAPTRVSKSLKVRANRIKIRVQSLKKNQRVKKRKLLLDLKVIKKRVIKKSQVATARVEK